MRIYKKIITLSLVISMTLSPMQLRAQSDDQTHYDAQSVLTYVTALMILLGAAWTAITVTVTFCCAKCNNNCNGNVGRDRGAYCHNLLGGCLCGYTKADLERQAGEVERRTHNFIVSELVMSGDLRSAQAVLSLIKEEDEEPSVGPVSTLRAQTLSAARSAASTVRKIASKAVGAGKSEGVGDEENQLESVHPIASSDDENAEYEESDNGAASSQGSWAAAVSDEENGDEQADEVSLEKEIKKVKRSRSLGKGKPQGDEGNE